MKIILTAVVGLGLGLAGLGAALAQENVQGINTNADGASVTSRAGLNPTANGEGGTVIYGDINTGPGYTVIGEPSITDTEPPPAAAAPEPVSADAAPVAEAPVDSSAAVADGSDLDGDNYADALEWDLGLDPNNPDSDGDGLADGDELTIYGTDATLWDSDGDGVSDGEELFGSQTDPLVWDDFGAGEPVAQDLSAAAPQAFTDETADATADSATLAQETSEDLTATDGNATTRGRGNASAGPGSVTRSNGNGVALLGPDGTYRVTDSAPADVTITGDTDVLSPPAAAPASDAGDASGPTCSSYGSWYDSQIAYENAGLTAADPALVSALDPDYDGIACEEGMS